MKIFDLLIYAIVALALILLLYTVISNIYPQQTSIEQIKTALKQADTQTLQGKTVSAGAPTYYRGASISKETFEKETNQIVTMECTDPENCCIRKSDQDNKNKCEKPFEWDYDYFEPKITGPVITNVRCLRYNGLPKCTIYFGKAPAQTEVNKINLMNTTSTSTELEVIVKNSGANELAFGKATLKLYKKSVNEWIETDYTQEPQEVTTLMPQESSHLYWSLTPKNPGKYKAEFTFEALNAGHDKKAIEFDKSVSVTCQINESKTDTLIGENGKFNELHYCNNCEYSYDCANAWKAKIPSKTFYPMTKEQTYCIKDTETGAC